MNTETPITLADASQAVAKYFGPMDKFSFMDEAARTGVIESLLELVNSPCPEHPDDYCECPRPILRNSYNDKITTAPIDRLRTFAKAFRRLPGGWPGIGEMEAIYAGLYPPGDGIERGSPQTPGYGWNDHASGNYSRMLPESVPEQTALPAPEEQLSDEERKALAAQFAGALASVAANQSEVGVDDEIEVAK